MRAEPADRKAILINKKGPLQYKKPKTNGAKRIRTADPLHAMQVLYQLSYGPIDAAV